MEELKISRAYRLAVDLRVISLFYVFMIAIGIAQLATPSWIGLTLGLIGGFFTVNFWEYAIHRYLFHPTRWGNQFKLWILKIHARHHQHVHNHLYSVAPISTSFGVILVSLMVQSLFNPSSEARWSFFLGLCVSYLYHEFVHHWVHHIESSHWVHRAYVRYHQGHHTGSAKQNYGFISPFWDIVFRTFARGQESALQPHGELPMVK